MNKPNKLIRRLVVGLIIGVIVIVGMGVYADGQRLATSLKTFQWSLLIPVLGLTLLNYALRFAKWHYYLHVLKLNVGFKDSALVFLSGLSMAVTPGKFGELLKAFLLKQRVGAPAMTTASVVVAERLTDVVALVFLCAGGVVSSTYGYGVVGLCVIGCGIFIAIVSSERLSLWIIGLLSKLPMGERIAPRLETMYRAMATLVKPGPLVLATVVSIAAWGCECLGFHWVLTGLEGTQSTLPSATFIYAFATLFGAVTMLPGGLGVTEGSLIGLTHQVFGLAAKAPATAGAMIIRFCTLWFAVVVGLAALLLSRNSSAAINAMDTPEDGTNE